MLQHAVDDQERLLDDDEPIPREQIRTDDDVRDAGLVLERGKTKPFAVPGRWRVITMPATRTRRPCRAVRRSQARRMPRIASSSRRSAIGWRPADSPMPA